MGIIISKQKFMGETGNGTFQLIVYCRCDDAISQTATSINKILAEKLIECPASRRTRKLGMLFHQIMEKLPEDTVIKDFDVLFNPEYKVDILKMMIDERKKKSFRVIWPGSIKDGRLIYAEDDCLDYRVFNVEDYDITCIV